MNNKKSQLITEYFVGQSNKNEWAGAYYYISRIDAEVLEKGELFMVLTVSGAVGFDANKTGNLLVDRVHEMYFSDTEEKTLLSVENAVTDSYDYLITLVENDDLVNEEGLEFSLLMGVKRSKYMYFAQIGDCQILGLREGEVSNLTQAFLDPYGEQEVSSGSLELQADDRFLLLTPEGEANLTKIDKKKILSDFELTIIKGKNLSNEALCSYMLLGYMLEEDTDDYKADAVYRLPRKEFRADEQQSDEEYEEKIMIKEKDPISVNRLKFNRNIGKIKSNKHVRTTGKASKKIVGTAYTILKSVGKFIYETSQNIFSRSNVYVRNAPRSRNYFPIVVILIILGVSAYFIIGRISEQKRIQEQQTKELLTIENIKKLTSESSSNVEILNSNLNSEADRSALIEDFKNKLDQLNQLEYHTEETEVVTNDINGLINELERKVVVSTPNIIREFTIVENSKPSDIEIGNERLYVADEGNGVVYDFDYKGGNVKRFENNFENPNTLAKYGDTELVVIDDFEDRSVSIINTETSETERVPGLSNQRIGDVIESKIYQVAENDVRLYLLRSGVNELIQLQRSESGYGLPKLRMSGEMFNNLTDVEINNGKIFLIDKGRGVRGFYGDGELGIEARGLLGDDNLSTIDSIYIDELYFYFGDTEKNRVLVFTKSRAGDDKIIDLVAQYDLSGFAQDFEIVDLVADRNAGNIYVLVDSKVISLPLSDLAKFKI